MTIYHTTPMQNLDSIIENGIKRNAGVVWLHDARRKSWAVKHLAAHHDIPPEQMVTLRVWVDRTKLQKVGGKVPGRWLYYSDISPENLAK